MPTTVGERNGAVARFLVMAPENITLPAPAAGQTFIAINDRYGGVGVSFDGAYTLRPGDSYLFLSTETTWKCVLLDSQAALPVHTFIDGSDLNDFTLIDGKAIATFNMSDRVTVALPAAVNGRLLHVFNESNVYEVIVANEDFSFTLIRGSSVLLMAMNEYWKIVSALDMAVYAAVDLIITYSATFDTLLNTVEPRVTDVEGKTASLLNSNLSQNGRLAALESAAATTATKLADLSATDVSQIARLTALEGSTIRMSMTNYTFPTAAEAQLFTNTLILQANTQYSIHMSASYTQYGVHGGYDHQTSWAVSLRGWT